MSIQKYLNFCIILTMLNTSCLLLHLNLQLNYQLLAVLANKFKHLLTQTCQNSQSTRLSSSACSNISILFNLDFIFFKGIMSLSHKLRLLNPFICNPNLHNFKIIIARLNNLSCKDKDIRKFEIVAKTQLLCFN